MESMRFILAAALAAGLAWAQAGAPKSGQQPRTARKSSPARAAQAQKDPADWPIREIRVTGAKHYTEQQIVEASGLKPGDRANKETLERARDRILATGCIEGVGWKYEPLEGGGGFRVTLQVDEPDQFLPWVLDRVPVEKAGFEARVKKEFPMFGETIPPSDLVLDRVSGILERMAAEKGFREPLAGKVTLIEKNVIAVVFGPKAPPPNIAEVRFTGARVIEPRYLVKSLSDVAVGMPFIEANFRMVLESQIRPMYEAVGHLRAAFPKFTAQPAANSRGVVVTVQVEEGPAYVLDSIEVRGTGLSEGGLRDAGQFKTGETVSYSEIGKGLNRILDQLKGKGYMKASYKAQRRLNDEKKTVQIFVDVDPGPQYRFGKLTVKGLDIETEPVIRKLWALKPGDPFRGGYPDLFLNQIRDRGIFDNLGETKAEVKPDDTTLTVDVTLTFKGEPPKPKQKRPEW